MDPIITLPDGFATGTLAYIGQLVTDISPFLFVIIGLPLAFWGVRKLVSLFRVRA